jgi:hypothetical protein
MRLHLTLSAFALSMPSIVFAQQPRNFGEVVEWVADFASLLVPVIIGIAFLFIMWGLIKSWIIGGGTEEGVQTGKMVLLTGIIGLTVMVGMWGLVSLVRNAIFF